MPVFSLFETQWHQCDLLLDIVALRPMHYMHTMGLSHKATGVCVTTQGRPGLDGQSVQDILTVRRTGRVSQCYVTGKRDPTGTKQTKI